MEEWVPGWCDWCGAEIAASDTYYRLGRKTFCSLECLREWEAAESQWSEDGGMLYPRDHSDPGMEHKRDDWGEDEGMARRVW
jgi:hypothetical protein